MSLSVRCQEGSKGSVPFTVNSLACKSKKWPQVIADQKTISLLERKFTKGWILHKRSKVIGIFRFGAGIRGHAHPVSNRMSVSSDAGKGLRPYVSQKLRNCR